MAARQRVDGDAPPDFFEVEAGGGGDPCGQELGRVIERRAGAQQIERWRQAGADLRGMTLERANQYLRDELGANYDRAVARLKEQALTNPEYQQVLADALGVALGAVGTSLNLEREISRLIRRQKPAIVGRWLDAEGYGRLRLNDGSYPSWVISAALRGGWIGPAPAQVAHDMIVGVLAGDPWNGVDAGQIYDTRASKAAIREVESMIGQVQHPQYADDPTLAIGAAAQRYGGMAAAHQRRQNLAAAMRAARAVKAAQRAALEGAQVMPVAPAQVVWAEPRADVGAPFMPGNMARQAPRQPAPKEESNTGMLIGLLGGLGALLYLSRR